MVRAYRSAVREAQAQQTRERILETTHGILERDGVAGLTIPIVAREAGVSIPTVYRHFPTPGDLLVAFFQWFRPRVGMTVERLLGTSAETVRALPRENFPKFEKHGEVLRALMDSPDANRVRQGSVNDRAERAAAMFDAPGWSKRKLQAAVGAIYAMQTPQTWRWLRDTWGLDAKQAELAATWAIQILSEALTKPRVKQTKKKEKKR
jgi:AcrR family transcriptional regulator